MRSAKATPSVKRFLWLGSLASAVLTEKDPHKEILTRDDWNVQSTEKIKDPNDPFFGLHIYFASKTEGEKAAFRFVKGEKVCPGFMMSGGYADYLCSRSSQ